MSTELRDMTLQEIREQVVSRKIVNKNFKLNSRRAKDSMCFALEEHFKAPIRVAIDIVFNHNGKTPVCDYCNKLLDMHDLPNYRPIRYTHKKCALEAKNQKTDWNTAVEKRKSTCLEKYGTEFYFDYDSMVTRSRETKKQKYGDENYVNIELARKTKLERYGDENYRNDEKIQATCIDKYGAYNPLGSREIIDKASATLNQQYGGRGLASSEIQKTAAETNKVRYGKENAMQSEQVAKKSINTRRKKYYGDELFFQLTEDISELYEKYYNDNHLSITKLASEIGVDKSTLARNFKKRGFEVLDRAYSCSTSAGETYLRSMIQQIVPEATIVSNTRKVIAPKEIDIFLPEYNLGIEYHGSYWHREEKVGDSHREKARMAQETGIRLLQIFDFELVEKQEKIHSVLKNALGKNHNKLYGRNCAIQALTAKQARSFCEENHLQGYAPAQFNYGLFDSKNNLVQLLSFSKPRFSINHQWEIIRSCTKIDYNVTGGLEKLWKHFLKMHAPRNVITYADARLFSGSSYLRLGFEYIRHSGSGYVWSNGITKISRHRTRKALLMENTEDINKTEKQIMASKGYYKILDAGNHVFEWNA